MRAEMCVAALFWRREEEEEKATGLCTCVRRLEECSLVVVDALEHGLVARAWPENLSLEER